MKLKYLYHGSITSEIRELEPRKRYTPGVLKGRAKPAIYAAADPAYAVAHGFPWGSSEGFDVYEYNGVVTLVVPKKHKKRLNQPVFIYKISGKIRSFVWIKTKIYISYRKVKPTEVISFSSVAKAIKYYKGKIKIV